MGGTAYRVPGTPDARYRVTKIRSAGLPCLFGLVASLISTPAWAEVRDFLGRPLAEVRVELGGQPFAEPAVLELIETRIGEPLAMERVRQTIDHLVGLGRFEDVRVYADAAMVRPDAVSLRWALAPLQRVSRVEIHGSPVFDTAILRSAISETVGVRPSTSRIPELLDALRAFYADRGYRTAALQDRLTPGPVPELVTLILSIDAGRRATLGSVAVKGSAPVSGEQLVAQLGLERGRPYDRPAIEARLARYEDGLRDLGYYEASVNSSVVFSEDGATAGLTLEIEAGPRVRVVFAGDPLPDNRRDALVPIRQERSVDLDLLEDASRNIERFLRQQGHRAAQARYTRETRAGEMLLTFTVSRGPLHRLASVEVGGNAVLSRADLAGLLQMSAGEPFVDAGVAAVAAAITELYRVRGFTRAGVKPDVVVQAERTENGQPFRPVAVRFVITEGIQSTVTEVGIDGAVDLPESRVRSVLASTTGRPFYAPQLRADREALEQLYRNEGFQNVRVEADSSVADGGQRVVVRWKIREGPRTIVDHVLVTGNVRTDSELIRREVLVRPGKPLGEEIITESQRKLAALGLFRRVRITELPHGASTNRDVLIEVEEAPSTTVSYGGGLEAVRRLRRAAEGDLAEARIEVAPRGFFEIGRRNLWGKNRSISLFTRVSFRPRDPAIDSTDPTDEGGYGFNEYRVVGTFREPRPFDTPGEMQLTGFFEQAVRSSFNFSRRGGRAEYARRLGNAVTVSGRYAFDYTRLFDEQIRPEDRLLVDRRFPQIRLSTFTASVLRDSRNDVIDPEGGAVIGVDASLAPRFAGSEVGFARTFMQGFLYRRLRGASRFVVAAGARLGVAMGFERRVERRDDSDRPVLGPNGQPIVDVVEDLPASERFFAGGDTTVRGFVLDQLGRANTLNDQGFPTGGNGLVVLNLELRSPYWKGLGSVGFLDAGNVFKRAGDVTFGDLRSAAGLGLRYRSPLGPLRVDLGFNLDRQVLRSGARERGTVFHISLGQAF